MFTPALLLLSTLWVLPKADAITVPPPPADSRAEGRRIVEMQKTIDARALDSIRYWDAGAPGYRWNEIAVELDKESDTVTERVIAALNIGIEDATRAAFHYKKRYARARPTDVEPKIALHVRKATSFAYPSEHAVTAGAAEAILTYLVPAKREEIAKKAAECARSRVLGGSQFESDVAAGLDLGRAVGARVVERLKKDGSDKKWSGSVPTEAGLWNGTNPYDPEMAHWKTWIVASPQAFRPPAPPKFGEEAMKDVRDNNAGNKRAAYLWAITGLARYWNEQASLKMFEEKIDEDPVRAAEIYATLSAAYYDALVACWDAKYAYWGIRPFQLDPTFKPLITTPNFPGYPSGHATFGALAATVLSHYFPRDAKVFNERAEEIAMSRLWGGIHFRIDNDAGLTLGRAIGIAAIARLRS